MRGGCGSEVVLETVNAPRAFLTTDSGFPVERTGAGAAHQSSLHLRFPSHRRAGDVRPRILDRPKEKDKEGANFIETFISDPSICRLYLGFSKLDSETAEALRKAMPR